MECHPAKERCWPDQAVSPQQILPEVLREGFLLAGRLEEEEEEEEAGRGDCPKAEGVSVPGLGGDEAGSVKRKLFAKTSESARGHKATNTQSFPRCQGVRKNHRIVES